MCGWGSRYLCLHYSGLVQDNVAQSYHQQGRVIRVEDSEFDYLLTQLAFQVSVTLIDVAFITF